MGTVSIWVRPSSRRDELAWDAWRERWVVHCRAAPVEGEANRAVIDLISGWLGVPPASVRWLRSGSSKRKELTVDGLTDREVALRLRARTARSTEPPAAGEPGPTD